MPSQRVAEVCADLAKAMADQESTFVARIKTIGNWHILVLEYDRQVIAAFTERRAALESTLFTEASVDKGVSGCSGKLLDDLRLKAQQEMIRLQGLSGDFQTCPPR
jgi:hypothetical protein